MYGPRKEVPQIVPLRNCFALSSEVHPRIYIQSSTSSVLMDAGNDKLLFSWMLVMINFAIYKRFGLVHRPEGLGRNKKSMQESGSIQRCYTNLTWDLFPCPHYYS